jgi:hypothetical protein
MNYIQYVIETEPHFWNSDKNESIYPVNISVGKDDSSNHHKVIFF